MFGYKVHPSMNLFTNNNNNIIRMVKLTTPRVKSGNFGHQVNSDIHLQAVEIQIIRLLISRLITIFTVCLVIFYFNN